MMHKVQMIQKEHKVNMYKYNYELTKLRMGDNIANHMAYIYNYILYDKMGFSFKKLTNFYKRVVSLRQRWQDNNDDEITSEALLKYAMSKKIDAVGFVNKIPMSHKLYLADIKGSCPLGAHKNIDYGMLSTVLLIIPVLKDTYRFSNDKINQVFDWILYCIDSYYRKQPGCKQHYLSDDDIWQLFVDEVKWDIREGKAV